MLPANSVPFEDPSRPFLERFLETLKLAFTDPLRLFSNLASDDIGRPFLYGVIVNTFAAVFGMGWYLLLGGLVALGEQEIGGFVLGTGFLIVMMLLSPLLVAAGLLISAGLYHLSLLLLGGARRGFPVTLRAVAYGQTPVLLCVVPFCGGLTGGIWSIVLIIMGAKLGHGTDTWRAILGYFLPGILCCCLVFVLGMVLGLVGGRSDWWG